MLKSIGVIWFGCSREVGCFSEGCQKKFYYIPAGGTWDASSLGVASLQIARVTMWIGVKGH